MNQEPTIMKAFRELLIPIVEEAVERALSRYLSPSTENKSTSKEIMDVSSLATYIHLTKSGVYALTPKRKIPHFKKGQRLYFFKTDIDDYIRQGKVKIIQDIETEAVNYIIRKR